MRYKHTDYCTLLRNHADKDILTRKLFDVNLRLYKTSRPYTHIIWDIAEYLLWCARTEKDGYKKPHGYSGANAGIPFNIIATPDEVMLNPHIIVATGSKIGVSDCGSLLLPKPIKVDRFSEITFEFWDLDSNRHERTGYFPTIQHEIDHNKGILITNREVS